MDKIHLIYKTSSPSGKYYVGRHTTSDINDGYVGSGKWVRSIKDSSRLIREILEICPTFDMLVAAERKYLSEHVGKENCMNFNNQPVGFGSGKFSNWHRSPESREIALAARRKRGNKGMPMGDSHWARNNEQFKKIASERFKTNNPSQNADTMAIIAAKTSARMKINNPMFSAEARKQISEFGLFATNNPAKIEYLCPHCGKAGKGGRFKSHHIMHTKCVEGK